MSSRQRYVSDELTHFVGQTSPDNEARFSLLINILRERQLKHGQPHSAAITSVTFKWKAKLSSNKMFNPSMVCFCDIPIEDLGIHVAKYSPFGIAFRKRYLVHRGATPVFYVARDSAKESESSLGAEFDANFAALKRLHPSIHGATKERFDKELSRLMLFMYGHVFSYFKFFDTGSAENDRKNYYMEREWRVLGNVDFELADVERLLIPRAYRERLRDACPEYHGQISFTDAQDRPDTGRRTIR